MDNASLKHQLLIAMPQMDDPNFEHTVTYVVEHGDDGAIGLTLNRPVSLRLLAILVDMDLEVEDPPSEPPPLAAGGTVQHAARFSLPTATAPPTALHLTRAPPQPTANPPDRPAPHAPHRAPR